MATRTSPLLRAPPLVGRERELAALQAYLDGALAGHGSLVLIGGEAGIGKTALAEALCDEAEARGALVLVGRCYDLTETPPYGPWVDLLGRYPPADHLPELPAAFARRDGVADVANQAIIFQQGRDFFAALARKRPLLILLDDLHWADQASLDLLRVIARDLAAVSLVLIVTYRADEGAALPFHHLLPTFIREGHAGRVDLQRLPDEAVRGLIAARYGLSDVDTARLTTYVQGQAEGNPFFLGEILRALHEASVLCPTVAGWSLGELVPIGVPPLLRQVIGGRLTRIDQPARHLIALAAVIGHEVPLALWRVVAAVDEETVLAAIEQAAGARLLESFPPGTHARFSHALIRQTLYEGIVSARCRTLHQQIGEALAASPAGDPDAVAYHFQQALDARAIPWLILAGERAERVYAWLTAADRFEAAIQLMAAYGADAGARGWLLVRVARLRRYTDPRQGIAYLDIAAQLATEANDDLLGALTLFHRGLLFCFVGEINRGLAEMRAGVMARERISAADRARAAAMPSVFALHGASEDNGEEALVHWLAGAGRYAEARALGERALGGPPTQLPKEMIVGADQTDIFRGLGYVYTMLALPEEADRAYKLVATGLRNEKNFANLGINAIDTLRFLLLYYADQRDACERLVVDAAAAWQWATDASHDDFPRYVRLPLLAVEGRWAELRQLPMATFDALASALRDARGPVLRHQGETGLAWEQVQEVLPNGPATAPGNVRFYVATGCQRLAAALAIDDGDLDTARAWLEAYDRWLEWSGAVLGQAEGHLGWAAYHRAVGEPTRAYERAVAALTHATEPRQPLALLAAHRMLGELDTAAGRYGQAASHLQAALTLADACAAPYERALTLLARATLRGATGDTAAAHQDVDAARAICRPLEATPALARADALARHLAALIAPRPTYPAGLTRREVEVLRLIARGKSNQEIAAALCMSVRTAERHVSNIYGKVEARGRVEATTFAFHHDLT